MVDGDGVREFVLPAEALGVEAVFVNGVRQVDGRDYVVDGGRLRFAAPLRRRSEVGLAGWILTALCASVDADGDNVDAIVVTASGRRAASLQPA